MEDNNLNDNKEKKHKKKKILIKIICGLLSIIVAAIIIAIVLLPNTSKVFKKNVACYFEKSGYTYTVTIYNYGETTYKNVKYEYGFSYNGEIIKNTGTIDILGTQNDFETNLLYSTTYIRNYNDDLGYYNSYSIRDTFYIKFTLEDGTDVKATIMKNDDANYINDLSRVFDHDSDAISIMFIVLPCFFVLIINIIIWMPYSFISKKRNSISLSNDIFVAAREHINDIKQQKEIEEVQCPYCDTVFESSKNRCPGCNARKKVTKKNKYN